MINIVICVLVFTKVVYIESTGNAGPVGKINIFYVNECEKPVEKDMTLETYLVTVGDDRKALNFKMEIPFDIDDTYDFLLIADKWVDGDWQTETYKTDGNLFEFINEYISKIWEKLRLICEPNIPDDNFIKAGTYELKELEAPAEDVEFPQILYGTFRISLYLMKDDEEIACRQVEAESIAP